MVDKTEIERMSGKMIFLIFIQIKFKLGDSVVKVS